jgi:hypothetical protein
MENLCFYLIFKCKVKTHGKKYKQLEKQKTYWSSIHLNHPYTFLDASAFLIRYVFCSFLALG